MQKFFIFFIFLIQISYQKGPPGFNVDSSISVTQATQPIVNVAPSTTFRPVIQQSAPSTQQWSQTSSNQWDIGSPPPPPPPPSELSWDRNSPPPPPPPMSPDYEDEMWRWRPHRRPWWRHHHHHHGLPPPPPPPGPPPPFHRFDLP